MPRRKTSQTGKKQLPANKQKGKKVCTCCHKEKSLTGYYLSPSPMYSLDQRVPMCKECCKKYALNEDGSINYMKFKELLMHIDKPLYYDQLFSSERSVLKENPRLTEKELDTHGYDILSKYFTLISMRQDRQKSYADSVLENFMHANSNRPKDEISHIKNKYTSLFDGYESEDDIPTTYNAVINKNITHENSSDESEEYFELTPEIINLFGEGYSKNEYRKMYRKYEKLKLNYTLQTSLHQEALATYVRFKIKEEEATARGDVAEATKWYDAAQTAADKAKLTPKQLTQSDLQGGINSFSDIFKAVEQSVDVIPILPKFKFRPNDAIDFIIWCYINYTRDLRGMPEVPYEDIYKFYDRKKKEYIDQYGDPNHIFEDDPSQNLRESIKQFITLPADYEDLGNESS